MASTSAVVLQGLSTPFLSGPRTARRSLLLAPGPTAAGGAGRGPRRLAVVAAAPQKKSWIPGVRGGGNLIDPEWLDGS